MPRFIGLPSAALFASALVQRLGKSPQEPLFKRILIGGEKFPDTLSATLQEMAVNGVFGLRELIATALS